MMPVTPTHDAAAWNAWCQFTDAAQVAPDTLRSYRDLASRYERHTGQRIAVEDVVRMAHAVGSPPPPSEAVREPRGTKPPAPAPLTPSSSKTCPVQCWCDRGWCQMRRQWDDEPNAR
jgi:hypothetical protein